MLVAPEPDGQTPHAFDEVYVVLDGEGDVEVEGERRHVSEGDAVFVAARADHRFSGYEPLAARRLQRPALRVEAGLNLHDDRRPDVDEAVDPLGFALR